MRRSPAFPAGPRNHRKPGSFARLARTVPELDAAMLRERPNPNGKLAIEHSVLSLIWIKSPSPLHR
jgi:hypothetical protein